MAGCGCSGAALRREVLRTSQNQPTRDGGYLLMGYPNCTTLYQGPAVGDSAYVVGRNTEFEKLFKRSDLTQATQWAIETRQQLENIPVVALCATAVEALLAA